MQTVRVNLQIAVTLLSRYVRRLAAFEEILDEGAKMSIGIKHFLAPLYGRRGPDASEMATPKRVGTSRPKFAFSRMDNKKRLRAYAELSRLPKATLFTTLQYGT